MNSEVKESFIEEVFGDAARKAVLHESLAEAATLETERNSLVEILREFSDICNKEGIGYFLLSDTLQGVVAYSDFPPGDARIHLGMLQEDYDRFAKLYDEQGMQTSDEYMWELSRQLDEYPTVPRRFPRLQTRHVVPVQFQQQQIFTHLSLPLTVQPYIEISIFNAVPDDFYMRKKFYRQMRRRNDFYETKLNMLALQEGRRPAKGFPFFEGLLSLFVPLRSISRSIERKSRAYDGQGMSSVVRLRGQRSKTIELDELFPYQQLALRDVTVSCPANLDLWAPEPLDKPTADLKTLQDAALRIVAEIDRVCVQLGIGYFVCGGTLLGYMRHGGFIPWDDDIDVGMPREDYERFKKEAPAILDSETFFLQTRETDPNIPYLFSKLRLNDSTYVTAYNQFRDFHKGICVDIFPFDAIPDDEEELEEFRDKVYLRVRGHNHVANRQYPQVESPTEPKKNLDWLIAQINGRLLARHYWKKSLAETQQAFDEIVQTYDQSADGQEPKYIASFIPTYTMIKHEDLTPYQRVSFEGVTVNIPANPDAFLRMQYGDYMTLPPRHKRCGHDLLSWSVTDDELDDGELG